MKAAALIAFVITLAAATGTAAQSAAEIAACKPDVFRLCTAGQIARAIVGDRRGVYACFSQHRRDLSRRCDHVLKKHGY